METFAAIIVILMFFALLGTLAYWEIKRYKAAINKENEQIALYKKISRKLDNM